MAAKESRQRAHMNYLFQFNHCDPLTWLYINIMMMLVYKSLLNNSLSKQTVNILCDTMYIIQSPCLWIQFFLSLLQQNCCSDSDVPLRSLIKLSIDHGICLMSHQDLGMFNEFLVKTVVFWSRIPIFIVFQCFFFRNALNCT